MSVKLKKPSRLLLSIIPALLIITASATAYYKIVYLGYNLDAVVQKESYFLELVMDFDGHGSGIDVELALPKSHDNQIVSDEKFSSADFRFSVINDGLNRWGKWSSDDVTGSRQLAYSATVITKNIQYGIDSLLPTHQDFPPEIIKYLMADSFSQSDNPEIAELADYLHLSTELPLLDNITSIYNYVTDSLDYVQYSGTTDALTTLHLGEASCGGKSRLMVALSRYLGIPARLVGGKILSSGKSKASHIWVELYIHGYWVPFCPTNHYFAEIPSNYLILYYGEEPLLQRTRDINFKYYFNLKKRLTSSSLNLAATAANPLDVLNIWNTFKRVAISLELLKIIIMLPIGILAVVLFRNIIGVETFGTFMPALIAIGFRDTGLLNGIMLFVAIILFGSIVRLLLTRFQLLHTPRLAIILSANVLFILALTAAGVRFGFLDLARVALFPMVILTLTVERFSLVAEESSLWEAIRISLLTLMVASFSYELMSWRFLQSIVIGFPEIILLVIALYLYIGRYSGFRLTEYFRFRHLLTRNPR